MPSFDIVCEIDKQEIDNAVNQTNKEISQRYDFKGSKSQVALEKDALKIIADDEYKLKALKEILLSKSIKRGIDIRAFDFGKPEPASGNTLRCEVKIVSGIETEKAKQLVAAIKNSKLKVQAQIQDQQVRVTGKKKDDLQAAMGLLKSQDFEIPLQFKNFRD